MWNPFSQRIRLDWLQIEISSSCNAACTYCPQTGYKSVWSKRFLGPEVLDNIMPFLHPKTYIHLQGWGEPFLHPHFFTMLESIKKQGFKVGTTTNGTLLSKEKIERLMDVGLDLLAFSTAGCSSEESDRIRRGTSLRRVVRHIETIQALRESRQSPFPKVHIAQMLLRSNLPHLDTYPAFWRNLGVEQVVLSSLSLVTRPELQDEARLADTPEEWDEFKERLYDLRKNNGLRNMLHFHLVSPYLLFKRCSENIEKSAVVGSGGDVSPCVMVNLPVSAPVTHWVYGAGHTRKNISWGNVRNKDIQTIWNSKEFRIFRKLEEMNTGQCDTCLKRSVETMETAFQMDPSSIKCRWEVLREANEEREAMRRMESRRQELMEMQ